MSERVGWVAKAWLAGWLGRMVSVRRRERERERSPLSTISPSLPSVFKVGIEGRRTGEIEGRGESLQGRGKEVSHARKANYHAGRKKVLLH